MDPKKTLATVLLVAFALVFVTACGGEEEPTTPDDNTPAKDVTTPDEGTTPETDVVEPPTEGAKTWKFTGESLSDYIACLKDLKENAPKALGDGLGDAMKMITASDDRKLGGKAAPILEKHGFTADEFKKFQKRTWMAVAAAGAKEGGKAAGDLGLSSDTIGAATGAVSGVDLSKVPEGDVELVKGYIDDLMAAIQ
jgi:hypothetical protein